MKNSILVVFLSFYLAGCASQISKTSNNSLEGTTRIPSQSETINIQTKYLEHLNENRNIKKSTKELNKLVAENIRSINPRNKITFDSKTESSISVNLSIEQFRYVSSVERFMTGIILGDAVLKVRVVIFDNETGKSISESFFDTESETMHGIFGATTPRQIEAMAKIIAENYFDLVPNG